MKCETSLPCFLTSEDGIKMLLPRSCTLATSISHSDRPPDAITVFLDLHQWRFQKDNYVLPSMCVRRRHSSHCCIMNRLGTPQCSEAWVKFVSLFHIWPPFGNNFEDLFFDRRNRRLSFQSLQNCFIMSTIVGLVVCFSIFVMPVLLLRYLLRYLLSQFLNL